MADDQDRLAQLRADIDRLRGEARAMSEGRQAVDMSADEIARLEEIESEVTFRQEQVQARERIERLTSDAQGGSPPGRRTAPAGAGDGGRGFPRDPRAGFSHFGDFAQSVAMAGRRDAGLDQRLASMAPTSFSSEGAGADGGYLIPPEFSSQIMRYIGEQGSLFNLVSKTPVNNHLNWPVDQESPWSTSGPQAYWEGEGDQYTQSKLKIRTAGMRLNKLVALCPVTDELLEDAAQLATYLESVIAAKMRWKVDFAILQGTGAGMPLGILKAPALKTVAEESGQTNDTVNSTNILKMYSALWGDFRGSAVWVMNQDVEPQLPKMVVAGSSSDIPVWLPPGQNNSLANAPNGTLMGRPIIPHQACETLGDAGDISFIDFSQYIIGYKTAGPQMAYSIHLYFDYGMTAVRATWRLAGMPKWSTTIAARDGSATYSPFVTLGERDT
ncbi:MAG: phage major capsid protein [Phycisphaerales bacterium]|jgi:HK97 family phage major capsid protein